MKKCTKCGIEKDESEFYKNKKAKDGLRHWCKACVSSHMKPYRQVNAERLSAYKKDYCEKNREKIKEIWRVYSEKNRDLINAKTRQYYVENKEKRGLYIKEWAHRNKGKCVLRSLRHRNQKNTAKPIWANEFFIEEAYVLARLRTRLTGCKYEVDHIIPLQGKNVCGLHVESNLQVIPAKHNKVKHNLLI